MILTSETQHLSIAAAFLTDRAIELVDSLN